MATNNLKEDVETFKKLINYNPSEGVINESRVRKETPGYRDNVITEDPEEDTAPEEGGEESPEGMGDFDFGDEGSPEEEGFGGEESPDAEEEESPDVEDEFGTASEFSAADELSSEEEEVEEIDVTAIITKSDEAKELAQQAVTVGQENTTYLQSLTDKLGNLEASLAKVDSIASKINKLEQSVKTPEEKLELRSLDSYPFNMKLTDYWEEKAAEDGNYKISTGKDIEDGKETEYVITPDDIEDYNEADIESSFSPDK